MDTQLLQAILIEKIKTIAAEDKLQALRYKINEMEATPYWVEDETIMNELRESNEGYEKGEEGFEEWGEMYKRLKEKQTHGS